MTLPRVVRDLLMFAPSRNRVPVAPVDACRSDPARSTREIFDTFSPTILVEGSRRFWVRMTVKTACDRELVSLSRSCWSKRPFEPSLSVFGSTWRL